MTSKDSESRPEPLKRPAQRPEVYSRDEHPISRRSIDPDALKIMYRLMRHGHKAYLVGGGVRDLLLNRTPKDFDIATDATPRKVKELFRNSRIIGRRFKLIHVFFRGNKIIEVSTFRDATEVPEAEEGEGSSEAQNAQLITRDNTYGTEVTDAMRRDITINALFYDAGSFSIIDYVGGMRDIRARIVRIIGDPDVRFAEDPVRLMRVCRHAAKSGFSIEGKCQESLKRNAELIKSSAPMRVFEELKKDFASSFLLKTLRLLAENALLPFLIPELAANNAALLDEESDFAKALSLSDDAVADGAQRSSTLVLALISIFSRSPVLDGLAEQFKDAEDVREHLAQSFKGLAVPRKEREKIEALLVAWHMLLTRGDSRNEIRDAARKDLSEDLRKMIELLYGRGPELELLQELESGPQSREHSDDGERFFQQREPRSGGRRRRRGGRGRMRHRQPSAG